MKNAVLILDSDKIFAAMLVEWLRDKGFEAHAAHAPAAALERLSRGGVDLLLADLDSTSGADILGRGRRAGADVIVMGQRQGRGLAPEPVLDALRRGAYDYLLKPFSLAELEVAAGRLMEKRALENELRRLKGGGPPSPGEGLIGQGEAMRRVRAMVERLGPLDVGVLVVGEPGVGKELAAEAIHGLSPRRAAPLFKCDCAALPGPVLEAELFGADERTGSCLTAPVAPPPSATARPLLGRADGSALFLDEVDSLPLPLQARLLEVMVEGSLLLGDVRLPADVRVISATRRDLSAMARSGLFLEELLERLSGAELRLPALRERQEDLPLLAEALLERVSEKLGTSARMLAPDALRLLLEREWPGNVRELRGVLERAAISCDGETLRAPDVLCVLQPTAPVPAPVSVKSGMPLRRTLDEMERSLLLEALRRRGGVQKDAAGELGLSPKNFWNKLRKHGIDSDAFRPARAGDAQRQ